MAGFLDVSKTLDELEGRKNHYDPYFYFEPWDCEIPTPEIFKAALEDGVDLVDDASSKLAGEYPRTFQTGSILSTKKMVVTQAGSRSGKSICTQVAIGAMISRRPPYAFRYPKGEDTGIKRIICETNITRFGRIEKDTGYVLDRNVKAKPDGTWDCGNITGAGEFPEELYAPQGSQIWIGTIAKSVDSMWRPSFEATGENRFFPQEFMDVSKGNRGFNWQQGIIHCINDIDIHIKTYEQGHTKFESQTCWLLAYDEEPPKKSIYLSGALHATYQRFSFTPLNGKTWSEEVFFACLGISGTKKSGLTRDDFDYFCASQFDSPYVPMEKLWRDRRAMEAWERRARVWGQYSEYAGMPFFNRSKIQVWKRDYIHPYRIVEFETRSRWSGMNGDKNLNLPGLLNVGVDARTVKQESEQSTWRLYENVREGVPYLAVFDAAEGAVDLEDVQDRSFGLIVRPPLPEDPVVLEDLPIVVATCRSTLPTVAFARSQWPTLRYFNNALLAAERGHGKDNEAFGLTLEEWPYWYFYASKHGVTKKVRLKKGFDTTAHTRTACLDKIRDWEQSFEPEQDPFIRDSWLYAELGGAIVKETAGGKHRCDHPRDGSLDGVICLGIGAYILQESPEVLVCNYVKEDDSRQGLFQRVMREEAAVPKRIPMGAGANSLGGR